MIINVMLKIAAVLTKWQTRKTSYVFVVEYYDNTNAFQKKCNVNQVTLMR